MKKQNSIVGAVVLAAFASEASAQSQVTMFGIVDLAVTEIKNGSAGSLTSVSSGRRAPAGSGCAVKNLSGGA